MGRDTRPPARAGIAAAGSLDNWAEAMKLLTFSPQDGRIWMNDRRMVMLDIASFGAMRAELIHALGQEAARKILMRIGFASGTRDADLLRERWPEEFTNRAHLGPQFHGIAGIVQVETLQVVRDPVTGGHYGDYVWRHSAEDDVHINQHGVGTEAACWMEIGYASGFITRMSGVPHLFREISCRSMGNDVCRVLEKPAAAWTDADEELDWLGLPKGPQLEPSMQSDPRAIAPLSLPLAGTASERKKDEKIVGESPALKASLHALNRAAPTNVSVLIYGESGVGKELFARTLHRLSQRAKGPFVAVNCAAIPDTLLEAELFGVERGAFTGAVQSRAGRFERARGGTLFLDEIGTLNPVAQAKLLRALQESEIERVGGTKPIETDVRIVAATNIDLRAAVDTGQFRDDLFFRLNVFPIHLPPLRERRDDIRLLMSEFLRRYNVSHGKDIRGFTLRATQALLNYGYPGNIRELQNLIERAVILAEGDRIDIAHLFTSRESITSPLYSPGPNGKLSQRGVVELPHLKGDGHSMAGQIAEALFEHSGTAEPLRLPQFEEELFSQLIQRALAKADGNVSAAARLLGMNRYQLEYRLKRSSGSLTAASPRTGSET
jgi:two-component system response regulator HydG